MSRWNWIGFSGLLLGTSGAIYLFTGFEAGPYLSVAYIGLNAVVLIGSTYSTITGKPFM